jgi:hypothetical protein
MVSSLKGNLILLDYKNLNYIVLSAVCLFTLFLRLFFAISEDFFVGLVIDYAKDYFDHLKVFLVMMFYGSL